MVWPSGEDGHGAYTLEITSMHVMIELFMNDTTVYFDSMVYNISTLAARKHEISPTIMKGRNIPMESIEHGVRSRFGETN